MMLLTQTLLSDLVVDLASSLFELSNAQDCSGCVRFTPQEAVHARSIVDLYSRFDASVLPVIEESLARLKSVETDLARVSQIGIQTRQTALLFGKEEEAAGRCTELGATKDALKKVNAVVDAANRIAFAASETGAHSTTTAR